MNKYTLTNETKQDGDIMLFRIQALTDFDDVKAGDLGGWVESENNLSQTGNARIFGEAWISGNARVKNMRDYIVFKNWWSSGRYSTWTRSNDMYKVGCFYGTGDELIKKAYADSEISGREYERIVKYVNEIKDIKL